MSGTVYRLGNIVQSFYNARALLHHQAVSFPEAGTKAKGGRAIFKDRSHDFSTEEPFNIAPIGTIGTVLLDRSNGTYWNTGTDWNVPIIPKYSIQ